MKKSILQMNKKAVNLERIKLINGGYLADVSYHLDVLIGKLRPSTPVRVYNNLYTIGGIEHV